MNLSELEHLRYGYIIGIGRSGTTLLTKLLNYHKNCRVSLELEFTIFFMHAYSGKTVFTEKEYLEIADFFEAYNLRHPVLKLVIDPKALFEELKTLNPDNYLTLTQFLHTKFNFYGKPFSQVELVLDKNPSYTLHPDKLFSFSRDVKFIYIVRDYRANILSRKQSIHYRTPKTAFNAYRWLFYNKKAFADLQSGKFPMHLVRYEDLAIAPNDSLVKMCSFLNISAKAEDMNFYQGKEPQLFNIEKVKSESERYKKMFSDIEKPVFTNRIEAWKTELTEKDIKICEAICGSFAEKLGYQPVYNLSFIQKLTIKASFFGDYVWALYDYYKEFILYYASPAVKLKRIKQKQVVALKNN